MCVCVCGYKLYRHVCQVTITWLYSPKTEPTFLPELHSTGRQNIFSSCFQENSFIWVLWLNSGNIRISSYPSSPSEVMLQGGSERNGCPTWALSSAPCGWLVAPTRLSHGPLPMWPSHFSCFRDSIRVDGKGVPSSQNPRNGKQGGQESGLVSVIGV